MNKYEAYENHKELLKKLPKMTTKEYEKAVILKAKELRL